MTGLSWFSWGSPVYHGKTLFQELINSVYCQPGGKTAEQTWASPKAGRSRRPRQLLLKQVYLNVYEHEVIFHSCASMRFGGCLLGSSDTRAEECIVLYLHICLLCSSRKLYWIMYREPPSAHYFVLIKSWTASEYASSLFLLSWWS